MQTVQVVPAKDRMHTQIGWLDSYHSFSFGEQYDPSNTHHGLLLVSNDDRVAPGRGFSTHPHRDMEIVTWVLEGALRHEDSIGTNDVITPGLAQRMSAGSGIRHSEVNASATEPVHLIQMWVVPDTTGLTPEYEQTDVSDRLAAGGLFALASGGREPDAAITIHQRDATLWVGRLAPGEETTIPDAPFVHVFVAVGSASFGPDAQPLAEGDAVRLTDAGALGLRAGPDGAEIIVWETHASVA
ncbi:MAG TPA: pirin family protein [Acidimicrobiia bacterium]